MLRETRPRSKSDLRYNSHICVVKIKMCTLGVSIKTIPLRDDYDIIKVSRSQRRYWETNLGRPDSECHITNGNERSVNLQQLQVLVLCIIFIILYSLYRVVSWYIIYE